MFILALLAGCAALPAPEFPPVTGINTQRIDLLEATWAEFAADLHVDPPQLSRIHLHDRGLAVQERPNGTLALADADAQGITYRHSLYDARDDSIHLFSRGRTDRFRQNFLSEVCQALIHQHDLDPLLTSLPLVAADPSLGGVSPQAVRREHFARLCALGPVVAVLEQATSCPDTPARPYASLIREMLYADLPVLRPIDRTPDRWGASVEPGWFPTAVAGFTDDATLRIEVLNIHSEQPGVMHLDLHTRAFSDIVPTAAFTGGPAWNAAVAPAHFEPPAPFDDLRGVDGRRARWRYVGDSSYVALFDMEVDLPERPRPGVAFVSSDGLAVARCIPRYLTGDLLASRDGLYLIELIGYAVTVIDLTDMADEAFGPAWRTPR